MTDIGEGIGVLLKFMEDDKKCDFKPKDNKWTANLEGSSTTLAGNLGNKPDASSEAELSVAKWPSQAHHLIPHLTLKRHPVADWLKEGKKLFGDTKYNVDHEKNGKWMPSASSLPEWKTGTAAKKRKLMFKIMQLSKIQLHQSRHSGKNRYGIGEVPYHRRVTQYLKKIKDNATSHYAGKRKCEDCIGKAQKNKYPPRENTVRYVDKASELIEKDINTCRIFVSRIAAEFAETGGFDK